MRTSLVLAVLLGALPGALAAAPALAQPPVGGPDAQAGRAAFEARRAQGMERRHAAMARAMKEILQLRPDQDAAFAAFEAATAPRPDPERQWKRGEGGREALTTPQRLDRGLERMQAHLERARARAAAVKTFYAALSPEQQRAFDALARIHGPMDQGGRMGPRGRMDHGGHGGPMGPMDPGGGGPGPMAPPRGGDGF